MQHHEEKFKGKRKTFRISQLTILQLMGLLAALGILAYFVLHWLLG